MTLLPVFFLTLFVCSVLGNDCPRTNRRPLTSCVDECSPSKGCHNDKHDCLCDGDCGYSCFSKNLKCRGFRLRNGKVIGGDRSFNATMKFVCDDKYTLFGSPIRRCRGNGNWDKKRPRCKIACLDPGIPDFAKRNRKKNPVGFQEKAVLTFYCFPGYQMKTSPNIECKSSGKWSSPPPVCEARNCGRVVLPPNSDVVRPRNWRNSQSHPYGLRLILRCKSGYRKFGLGVMRCDGSWKILTRDFRCLETCSDPRKNTNAVVVGQRFYHGMRVSFICSGTNYILVPEQSKELICTYGKWNRAIPLCKGPCRSLKQTQIRNGRVSSVSSKHGSRALFFCYSGYKLIGSSTSACDDGLWSLPVPKCSAICQKISNIRNGWVSGDKYLEDDEISFRCKQNYVLVGQNKLTCTSNRRWSARTPACKAPCPKLQHPNHGKIISQGFKHNENVHFTCDTNYVMEGQAILTCSGGSWSAQTPRCFAPCKKFLIGELNRGYIKQQGFRHGETVTFDCSGSYVIEGHSSLRCSNGNWDNEMPSCGEPCTALKPPFNGKIIKNGWRHREETSFKCNEGYKLFGHSHHVCFFGVWNKKLPSCKAICSRVVHLANGRVFGKTYLEGDQLRFQCLQGYVLDGQQSITCQSNRTWSARKPVCRAICSPVVHLASGKVFGKTYLEGDQLRFQCLQGYVLDGQQSITCQSNRTWSAEKPACRALRCNNITYIRDGRVTGAGVLPGDERKFSCKKYFNRDGVKKVTCLQTGQWDSTLPKCLYNKKPVKDCIPITGIKGGRIINNVSYHGGKVKFECFNSTYIMKGKRGIRCVSGTWKRAKPKCLAPCKAIAPPKNGIITSRKTTHGGKVKFQCHKGYRLSGQRSLTCNDGSWNGSSPTCRKQS